MSATYMYTVSCYLFEITILTRNVIHMTCQSGQGYHRPGQQTRDVESMLVKCPRWWTNINSMSCVCWAVIYFYFLSDQTVIPLCKAKRQYLLTCRASKYFWLCTTELHHLCQHSVKCSDVTENPFEWLLGENNVI